MSPNTTVAYRDALKLFLRFAAGRHKRKVDSLTMNDLNTDVVLAFLDGLESTRKNTVQTRNARLAAIHCFFRYVLDCEPSLAALCQRVLAIPVKKTVRPSLGYLTAEELESLLAQVDRTASKGQRDYLLLTLLYDTGARIQELLDMKPADFQLTSPAFVRVLGKGHKERVCPLLPQTARVVIRFLESQGRKRDDESPLFQNRRGGKLTRQGARYLLRDVHHKCGQDDAESQPFSYQPTHAPSHESDAPSPVWRPDHHDQGCTRSCGCEVHRGLRSD